MHYYHDVPGRLRVQSPFLKGNVTLGDKASEHLMEQGGVLSASANPITGSIVVTYDPKLTSSSRIMAIMAQQGYFHTEKAVTTQEQLDVSLEKVGQLVGKAVLCAVVKQATQGTPLAFVGLLL